MIKKILQLKLKFLASLMLNRYRPTIIAVTGSVGKTSSKEAIYTILKDRFLVRKSYKSYNNQIGVPLTILGFKTSGRDFWAWLKILLKGLGRVIYQKNYPQILILEMGADRKGDLAYLTSFAPPDISVLTGVGSSHMEYFKNKEELLEEKATLIKALPYNGKAVLNFDDDNLKKIGLSSDKEVIFYGFGQGANLKATNYKLRNDKTSFKVELGGNSVPVKANLMTKGQVYSLLAAFAVGSIFKLDLVKMSKSAQKYQVAKGRGRILKGKKETTIIDDSYNSAPESAENALNLLDGLKTDGRKVAILGDMLELGEESKEAHRTIGKKAAETADLLIFVGKLAKNMKKVAQKEKEDNIYWFEDVDKLNEKILSIIQPSDIILVKASQGIRLEKAVEKILADELEASKELVRQSKEWSN